MRECLDEGVLQSYFDGELNRQTAEGVALHLASCVGCTQAWRELESEDLLLSAALEPEFSASVPTERLRQRIDAAIAGRSVAGAEQAKVVAQPGGMSAIPAGRGWVKAIADLFTIAPQRAFGYAGAVAVILLAAVMGGIYWQQGPGAKVTRGTIAGSGGFQIPVMPIAAPQVNSNADSTQQNRNQQQLATAVTNKRNPSTNLNQPGKSDHVRLLPGERSYLKTIATLSATLNAESSRQMKPALQAEYERNLAMVDQAIAATRSAAKVNPNDPDAADFMFAAYQSKIDLLNQVADSRLSNRQH